MKDLLKSKTMIFFMVMVLGVVYFNSSHIHKLESSTDNIASEGLISANIN